MREIKFRGKRDDTGQWVYGYYFEVQGTVNGEVCKVSMIRTKDTKVLYLVDSKTVGQFTGLYDIHEKEIWEDDYVKCPRTMVCDVNYKNGSFYFWMDPAPDVIGWGWEVVGNMHD